MEVILDNKTVKLQLEEYISDLNLDAEQSNENEQNVGILDVSEYFE